MSYINNHLMKNEQVIIKESLHWVVFWWPILFATIAAVLLVRGYLHPALALLAISALAALQPWMVYATTEFAVTDQRVVVKKGLVGVDLKEVLLAKVESVQVDQGFWGSILGFGSITLTGTGGTHDPIKLVPNPMVFEKRIQEQIASRGSKG
jgi:uncharacterized membrane protein YdbT with pleckstrin-like domain